MLILACDPTFSPILLNYIYAITNAKKKEKKIVRYSFSIEGRWKVKKRTAATHTPENHTTIQNQFQKRTNYQINGRPLLLPPPLYIIICYLIIFEFCFHLE